MTKRMQDYKSGNTYLSIYENGDIWLDSGSLYEPQKFDSILQLKRLSEELQHVLKAWDSENEITNI